MGTLSVPDVTACYVLKVFFIDMSTPYTLVDAVNA